MRTYSPPQNGQMPAARFSEFKASPKPLPMHPSPQQYHPHSTPTSGSKPSPSVALTPEQFAEMNAKLDKEERRFESVLAKVSPALSADERHAEIKRLKAGSSTRKSIIRREYGVQVRRSKVATANAVRTASGGVDVAMVDRPPSTNGFAAINRIAPFRAEPEHDAKRRRTGEEEVVRGRNPSMYDPLRDNSDRSRSVEYPRPGYNGAQQPHHEQVPKSDNRPTTAERQNGIIPRSRPPPPTEPPSHGTPQHDPYRRSSYQQHHTPTGGFTSVNTEPSASSTPRDRHDSHHPAPLPRMSNYAAPPFYVDQERRDHAHPPAYPSHDNGAGTFGVLKSKRPPVRDAHIQWDNLRGGEGQYSGQGATNGVGEKRTAQRTGDLIEILSDSSSYSHTPPSEKPVLPALQKPAASSLSADSSIPPEARQSAGTGGKPTAHLVHSSPRIEEKRSERRGEESDSDDGSDTSIPARRTPGKSDAIARRDTLSVRPSSARAGGKYGRDEKENRGFE